MEVWAPKSLHVLLQLGYFHDLLLIILKGNVTYFRLPGPNHIQNITSNCKILNVFCTWIVGKRELNNLIF